MTKNKPSCLIIGALPISLVAFRGPLIKTLLTNGINVCVVANGGDPDTNAKIQALGVAYYPIRIARAGMNPLADVVTFFDLIRLIQRVKPDMVLNYTIKPVIYGGLAARFCGVEKIFSLIEGLGHAFMPWESLSHGLSSIIAKVLYRISLLSSHRVFFLNSDDINQFVKDGYVSSKKAILLDGIGVDLDYYPNAPFSKTSKIRFLLIARLLKEKGIRDFIEAAKIVRKKYRSVEFELAGDLDENPSSIKQEELDLWRREGIVDYVGQVDDVRPLYRDCHIYVLPSYREGMPRTVLEALSSGRPVITTDVPGCKETVRFSENGADKGQKGLKIGRNGILVPPQNAEILAAAMEFFIEHPEQIAIMGRESRCYAQQRYDVHNVNDVMLREMGLNR